MRGPWPVLGCLHQTNKYDFKTSNILVLYFLLFERISKITKVIISCVMSVCLSVRVEEIGVGRKHLLGVNLFATIAMFPFSRMLAGRSVLTL
jgi:hypothetical protein